MVKCGICGKEMKTITPGHIRLHGITKEEFLLAFPQTKFAWNTDLTKDTDSRIKGTTQKGHGIGHKPTFNKEVLGEERYNLINEQRKLKISKNSNTEACRKGGIASSNKRKTLPNYGYTETGLKSMSKASSARMKGHKPWNDGLTKLTNESIRKMAEKKTLHHERIDRKAHGFTLELRQRIRTRDGWKCVKCGILQKDLKYVLCIHHIDEDPKHNDDDSNFISLCRKCHYQIHAASLIKSRGLSFVPSIS